MSKTIGYDFQGWPVKMLTLREILEELGFTEKDGRFGIDNNDELLDAYPVTVEDDGMGYGIEPQYIVEADNLPYEKKVTTEEEYYKKNENGITEIKTSYEIQTVNVFNLFRETPHNKLEEDEE